MSDHGPNSPVPHAVGLQVCDLLRVPEHARDAFLADLLDITADALSSDDPADLEPVDAEGPAPQAPPAGEATGGEATGESDPNAPGAADA